jgi:ankyrin repeat protein
MTSVGPCDLIAKGAEVNAKDNTVQSAYLISTSEGYLGVLDLTLKHGADVDSKDSFNGTGLIRAADRGHADLAGRLVQADVKINHINNLGWTALLEAVILGDGSQRYQQIVTILLDAGADRPQDRRSSRRYSFAAC